MSRRYPSRPLLGIGAVILDGEQVLLVKRGREPLKGIWSIPGGALEIGETLIAGLRREVREEVGLEVRVLKLIEVFERITPDPQGLIVYHYVLLDYLCEPLSRELQPADDVDAAAWVRRDELSLYTITEGTPEMIDKAFALRQSLAAQV
jgi:ADP-ribose pyrophosphatase YjhB (NUDIX family)